MLRLFSDAFRHGGPVGGWFVGTMVLVWGGALFLSSLPQDADFLGLLGIAFIPGWLVLLLVALRRRQHGRSMQDDSGPIHRWPKLGQNDRSLIRSKLQQPMKRL